MEAVDKKQLRRDIRKLREAMSQEERRMKSVQIADKVVQMREFQEADIILLYSAIKSEVETVLLYQEAGRQGKAIYYPRVLGDDMEFYLVDENTEFEISGFGVREPKIDIARQYFPKADDVVFVLMPGMVFDKAGNRIGYGGGYYDKYLQNLRKEVRLTNICKVAVAYECQMVALGMIKSESYDIQADYVVTERDVYKI